jgi:hypothetical protein
MKIKNILLTGFILLQLSSFAQTTIQTTELLTPAKPIMLGGGIVLGGGNGSFQIGLNPELLKSYNPYIDLGVALNLYYTSYNPVGMSTIKSRNTQYGLGGFVRAWPLEQFFIQVQPEYNWTWSTAKDISTGVYGSSKVGAPSVLTGIGYGHRNEHGMSYFSVMFDLVNDIASPYRMGQLKAQPIFRAGFGFTLRSPKKKTVK